MQLNLSAFYSPTDWESFIAREVPFENLRYFKRIEATEECPIPNSKVINLTNVFGAGDDTARFITRYLHTTHCDLFFADAAIFVEGAAESMLLPHFIRNKYPKLNQRYITILEINGRHSQRLKPLIEKLCLPTLIITDIDSGEPNGHHVHTLPERDKGIISTNYAITKWLVKKNKIDELLDLSEQEKTFIFNTPYSFPIRIAYQNYVNIDYNGNKYEAIPSTFEDCLVYTNLALFKKTDGEGLIGEIYALCNEDNTFDEFHNKSYELFRKENVPKASFALDLIYSIDPDELSVPAYIHEGLMWLEGILVKEN